MNQPLDPLSAVELGAFLATPSGHRVIEHLRLLRPAITGETMESCALSGREAAGWEKCLTALLSMAQTEPSPEQGAGYMNMADDSRK